jgi:hypothetical protein
VLHCGNGSSSGSGRRRGFSGRTLRVELQIDDLAVELPEHLDLVKGLGFRV